MSRILNSTALVALVATLGMTTPGFAAKSAHHGKHGAMHASRAHHGHRKMARAAPAAAPKAPSGFFGAPPVARANDGPFGPGNLLGGINGNGKTSGGAEDPANFKSSDIFGLGGGDGLLGGGGLLGTGVGGGQGVLGTGVLDGQGALGLGVFGL